MERAILPALKALSYPWFWMAALSGVNIAAFTPRRESPEPDMAAMFELIDFLCGFAINGIALMGATGEFVHFGLEERCRLVSLAIKRSKVPVIPGVGHSTLAGALCLAREAADAGAAAVLLMPPYFFRYGQEEVREFYLRFAGELNGAVPVLLYNLPLFTTGIACDTAIDLLATGLFDGIKDSSGCWDDFLRLRAAREQRPFRLLVGNDTIFAPARKAGADGVISGCACAVPELLVGLDRAIAGGDQDVAKRLETRLRDFIGWIDLFPSPVGIREALAARGLKTGPAAAPLSGEKERKLAEFREWFKGWLPVVRKEAASA